MRINASEDWQTKYAAIKVQREEKADNLLLKEFLVMKAIGKHPNIIKYIEFASNTKRFFNETMDDKI